MLPNSPNSKSSGSDDATASSASHLSTASMAVDKVGSRDKRSSLDCLQPFRGDFVLSSDSNQTQFQQLGPVQF